MLAARFSENTALPDSQNLATLSDSGAGVTADLVPLNYILADLVPPPKCRFYLNIF